MRVLHATKRENSMQTRCKGCGSLLEVTREDVEIVSCRSGGTEYTYRCPVCDDVNYDKELRALFKYHDDEGGDV